MKTKINKHFLLYTIIPSLILALSIISYADNDQPEDRTSVFTQLVESYIDAINSKMFESFNKLYHPNAPVDFSAIQEKWKRNKHSLELLNIETLYAENRMAILRATIHWKSSGRGIKPCLSKNLVVLKMWDNEWRVWIFDVIDFQLIDWDPKTQHGPGES